jgi:hypothetical protein
MTWLDRCLWELHKQQKKAFPVEFYLFKLKFVFVNLLGNAWDARDFDSLTFKADQSIRLRWRCNSSFLTCAWRYCRDLKEAGSFVTSVFFLFWGRLLAGIVHDCGNFWPSACLPFEEGQKQPFEEGQNPLPWPLLIIMQQTSTSRPGNSTAKQNRLYFARSRAEEPIYNARTGVWNYDDKRQQHASMDIVDSS